MKTKKFVLFKLFRIEHCMKCAKRNIQRIFQHDEPFFQNAERSTTEILFHEKKSNFLFQRKQSFIVRFPIY